MMRLELYLARRYLSAHGCLMSLITLIPIGGIFVGVMALIFVIALMSGLQTEVRDRILGTNPHIYVFTYGEGLRLDGWRTPLAEIRKAEGVTIAEPFVYSDALIFQDVNYQQGVQLRGIRPAATARLREQLVAGDWKFHDGDSGLPGIVLGFRLAERLLVRPGDTVNLVTGAGAELTPAGFIPKFKKFEAVGTFRSGMYEYDNQMAYVDLQSAQDLLGLGEAVTGLAVWVSDVWSADLIANRLQAELGHPYTLRNWKTMNEGLFSALRLEKLGMALILLLIVLVAAFNIVSILIMVVVDKTREIGILRSMGMTSARIGKVFRLQGVIIGVTGTTLGVLGGLVLCWAVDFSGLTTLRGDVYIISKIPLTPNPLEVALIMALSVLISFAATILPSRQAARLTPVEAIRHE